MNRSEILRWKGGDPKRWAALVFLWTWYLSFGWFLKGGEGKPTSSFLGGSPKTDSQHGAS